MSGVANDEKIAFGVKAYDGGGVEEAANKASEETLSEPPNPGEVASGLPTDFTIGNTTAEKIVTEAQAEFATAAGDADKFHAGLTASSHDALEQSKKTGEASQGLVTQSGDLRGGKENLLVFQLDMKGHRALYDKEIKEEDKLPHVQAAGNTKSTYVAKAGQLVTSTNEAAGIADKAKSSAESVFKNIDGTLPGLDTAYSKSKSAFSTKVDELDSALIQLKSSTAYRGEIKTEGGTDLTRGVGKIETERNRLVEARDKMAKQYDEYHRAGESVTNASCATVEAWNKNCGG